MATVLTDEDIFKAIMDCLRDYYVKDGKFSAQVEFITTQYFHEEISKKLPRGLDNLDRVLKVMNDMHGDGYLERSDRGEAKPTQKCLEEL